MDLVLLNQALAETLSIRTAHEREYADRIATLRSDETYRGIDDRYTDISFEIAKRSAYGEDVESLEIERDRLDEDRRARVVAMGYPIDYIKVRHDCERCADTGYVGTTLCDCVKGRVATLARAKCRIPNLGRYTFEQFDESIFSGTKQEKAMLSLYTALERYADKFPTVKYLNLLLSSPTGVGKTSLISCVVNRLVDRGYDVEYLTAFEMNDLMVKYHTTQSEGRGVYLDKMLECDMLVIDDLGAEPILNNVTRENLLTVLNERKNRGRHTIISTNLNETGLKDKYGERITYRLLDNETTLYREIIGDDMRIFR